MLNNKFLLGIIIFTYIITNILVFTLLDNSKYSKSYFICEKNLVLKQNFAFDSITKIIRVIITEAIQLPNVSGDVNKNALQIKSSNEEICEESLNSIKRIIDGKISNFIEMVKRKNIIADQLDHEVHLDFITELAIIELAQENNIEIIGYEITNADNKIIENSSYTIVVYVIFNFFLTLIVLSTYVYYKNSKFFGLKSKRKV